jgi:tRNA pseudouridine38-40 synthase
MPSVKCPTATIIPFATLRRHRSISSDRGDRLRFSISANRFLGRMVRIITGKLIDIGTGALSVDEFEHYLIHPQETQLIKPAYPQGLYLSKIKYPYLDIPSKSNFVPMLANGLG